MTNQIQELDQRTQYKPVHSRTALAATLVFDHFTSHFAVHLRALRPTLYLLTALCIYIAHLAPLDPLLPSLALNLCNKGPFVQDQV